MMHKAEAAWALDVSQEKGDHWRAGLSRAEPGQVVGVGLGIEKGTAFKYRGTYGSCIKLVSLGEIDGAQHLQYQYYYQ